MTEIRGLCTVLVYCINKAPYIPMTKGRGYKALCLVE